MFKLLGGNAERTSRVRGSTSGRIASSIMGDTQPVSLGPPRRPAYLPATEQESAFDAGSGPRLQGLEKRIPGNAG